MKLKSTPELKEYNKEHIRTAAQERKTFTKSAISSDTALSAATCGNTINSMILSGEVREISQEGAQIGRPAVVYEYNMDYMHVAAVAAIPGIHVDTIEIATADAVGTILSHRFIDCGEKTYQNLSAALREEKLRDPLIRAVDIGVPGVVNQGVVEYCDIAAFRNCPLAEKLSKELGLSVDVRNDMDYIAKGAWESSGEKKNTGVLYFPGGGSGNVGCGFVIDGKILKGSSNFAGEIYVIPEALGITKERQKTVGRDRMLFLHYAAEMVVIVTVSLNPERVILMGGDLRGEDIAQIRQYCEQIIPKEKMSAIEADPDFRTTYLHGTIQAALDRVLFPVSREF